MWHGGGAADIDAGTTTIDGRTRIHTGETTFQNKGHRLLLDIDGSRGASVVSDSGVVFQLMEADDPGFSATAVYRDPTDAVVKNTSFDIAAAHARLVGVIELLRNEEPVGVMEPAVVFELDAVYEQVAGVVERVGEAVAAPLLARLERGQERRMPRRDADVAHHRRRENHRGFARENLAFGADDVDVNCCHE